MTTQRPRLWVGIDASKAHHWWVAIDDMGTTVRSRKVSDDEAVILAGLSEVLALAGEVRWAADLTGTAPALLLALLADHGQPVVYVPGRTVNRMSAAYRGEAKTDARDAYVIADTARLRRDFAPVNVPTKLAADLALLTTHRSDLIADRVRLLNRVHDVLTGISPALEAAFDYADHKGALILLTGYQTPAALRRCGQARLTLWLATRGVRHPETVAATAVTAAHAQHIQLPGQDTAAGIAADLATQILALDERLKQLDRQISDAFRTHPQAAIIESMPGIGPILGAEFLVAAGNLAAYPDSGHLASAAGLVPVAKDSGRRTGNLHRPQRYSRRLRRVFYLSAQTSIIRNGPNRTYYLKQRVQGHIHMPAVIALARRRVDVLWTLLRDNRPFTNDPPPRTATATAARPKAAAGHRSKVQPPNGGAMSPLTITWTLRHHGWAFCKVADEEGEAEVFASYVTDGPEQLLQGITRLALTDTEGRVEFEGEPQVYRWLFRREGADVEIRLLRAPNFKQPDSAGIVLWSSRQTITALVRAALRAFDQVAHELGDDGYASQWGRPFPHAELEALRTALHAVPDGHRPQPMDGAPLA